jgi:hypothetical protein
MKQVSNRFRISLCCFALALASAAATAASPAVSLAGISLWSGQYAYSSGQPPVPFTLTLNTAADGSFTGFTTEPATFGNGTSKALTADVQGSVNGNRIYFRKTYDGSGGQNHAVEYNGVVSADGHTLSGSWKLDALTGSFSAERVAP